MPAADSAKTLHNKGQKAEDAGDYETAYDYYVKAYRLEPANMKYRVPYERMRFLAAASKVHRGQKLREQGKLDEALALFQQAAQIDPSNDLAAQEIRRTQQMMQKAQVPNKPQAREEEDPLKRRLENATGPAELGTLPNVPLDALEMTDDSKVLYETIGKLGKINVLFDPDYTSRRLTIHLQKVSLQEALDILALESRTFWRPVTSNTIFVAQDTQAKRRELEQNVVKTFYLGNVSGPTDLQDIVNAIRTVLEVQRIQQIPSQSAIVIKGTPDQLALAEKMIDDIDKSKPEVIVDVIVAQVRRDKLRDLGITPPQNATIALQNTNTTGTTTTGGTTTGTGGGGVLNFNDLQHLNSTNYAVTIDPVKVVALFNDSDARILQSPRVRATDNEKAQLKIADKIPIATGSFGTPVGIGTATGAVGVNTQFTYTDVGVIMEITPRVHPDGQVTLKTVMEISNQSNTVIIGGIQQPVISTRRVEHTIRLADGEVNLMGGIMEQQDTITRSGTPFLGQIPLLHYLFSEEKKERITNEIVFLLIPHIVRSQELNDLNRRAFDVGTGQGIDLHIAGRQTVQPTVASAPAPAPAPAPASTMQANPAAAAQPRPTVTQPSAQPPATHPASQALPAMSTPSSTSNAVPGATMLKLDPTSFSQQQGSSFTVNVMMAHGQDIASVPIQISYDPRILQFVNVSNGDFLARDGQPVALVHRDDPSAGKLQVTAQRPPGSSGVTGEGTVFSLVFTAKTKGTGNVSISVPGARNSQNQPLDVLGSQAAVTVN
ncbi:MAG TPA: cohesin domain-containing protein [Candidatus Limnocylindrales bacterium]|nr:cohesin domain-containing protein [Candidatus Limnocylindrales bacterium]